MLFKAILMQTIHNEKHMKICIGRTHALVYHLDCQTCNRSLVKAFLAALPDLHFGNVNRYEWSDMSIQLPGSNSQVKAPSIHLKSCFHFDNFNRYWFHIVVWLLDYLKLWNSNHDAQRVRETFTFEVTIHMSFTLHCCMNHLRIL